MVYLCRCKNLLIVLCIDITKRQIIINNFIFKTEIVYVFVNWCPFEFNRFPIVFCFIPTRSRYLTTYFLFFFYGILSFEHKTKNHSGVPCHRLYMTHSHIMSQGTRCLHTFHLYFIQTKATRERGRKN